MSQQRNNFSMMTVKYLQILLNSSLKCHSRVTRAETSHLSSMCNDTFILPCHKTQHFISSNNIIIVMTTDRL